MSAFTSRLLAITLLNVFARAENLKCNNTTEHIYPNIEIPSTVPFSEIRFPLSGNGTYPPDVSQTITIKSDGHSKIKIFFTKFEIEFSAGYASSLTPGA